MLATNEFLFFCSPLQWHLCMCVCRFLFCKLSFYIYTLTHTVICISYISCIYTIDYVFHILYVYYIHIYYIIHIYFMYFMYNIYFMFRLYISCILYVLQKMKNPQTFNNKGFWVIHLSKIYGHTLNRKMEKYEKEKDLNKIKPY